MQPFLTLDAVALPMARPNIDTDQIVPSRYLQKPRSDDFGAYLFRDLRFASDGSESPDFPLNRTAYRASRIIVGERNFGCGSSREHAVWALYDYGFRAAIAPSFGDIFASNAVKNGFLPIVLPHDAVARLLDLLERSPGTSIAIHLPAQTVSAPDGQRYDFAIDPFAKRLLVDGLDELGYTLSQIAHVETFEKTYSAPV